MNPTAISADTNNSPMLADTNSTTTTTTSSTTNTKRSLNAAATLSGLSAVRMLSLNQIKSNTESPDENTTTKTATSSPAGLTNTTPVSPTTLQQDRSTHALSSFTSDGKSTFNSFSFSPSQQQQQEEQPQNESSQQQNKNDTSNSFAPHRFTPTAAAGAPTRTAAATANEPDSDVVKGEMQAPPVSGARTTNLNKLNNVREEMAVTTTKVSHRPHHHHHHFPPSSRVYCLGDVLNSAAAATVGVVSSSGANTASPLPLFCGLDAEGDHLAEMAAATARTKITGKTKGGEDYDDDDDESFSDFSDDDDDERDEDECDNSGVLVIKVDD